ncbi:MAG: hypothetical protein JSW64_09045 [Candidatus Zixiibacteriota bacterium]|nr:MAG: hypothetical protein JSW64_09045 [candidate division Zixibacteria bacterium]
MDSYKKAMEKMNAVSEKMTRGEETHVCNMCGELNSVYKSGAEWNMVNSDNVFVGITTSGNSETVKMIHAWEERTTEEMLDMAQGEHSGHKH